MKRWQHRLQGCRRGAAALEYALLMPLLFGVIFVSIELTFILFADANLESAANAVTRLGRTGVKQADGTATRPTCSDLYDTLRANLAGWVYSSSTIYLDGKVYQPGAANTLSSAPGISGTCATGQPGDMVIYRVGFTRPGLTGFIAWLGQGTTWRSERVILVQNER